VTIHEKKKKKRVKKEKGDNKKQNKTQKKIHLDQTKKLQCVNNQNKI